MKTKEFREMTTEELQDIIENVNNFAKCEFDIKHRIIKSLHTDILDLVLNISEKICDISLSLSAAPYFSGSKATSLCRINLSCTNKAANVSCGTGDTLSENAVVLTDFTEKLSAFALMRGRKRQFLSFNSRCISLPAAPPVKNIPQ